MTLNGRITGFFFFFSLELLTFAMVPGYHLMPPLHRASTRFTSLLTLEYNKKTKIKRNQVLLYLSLLQIAFDLRRRCDTFKDILLIIDLWIKVFSTEEIYGAFQPRNNFARVDCAPETVTLVFQVNSTYNKY